jgi:hypothetical protein
MTIKNVIWGLLLLCGMACRASTNEVQRPPQADPPMDFDGSVAQRLEKHRQNLAAIRYRVAVQLECVAKEDDLGAALEKCIRYIEESTEETEPASLSYIQLLALESDIYREIAEAKRANAAIGDDNESSEAGHIAVTLKEGQKQKYDQLKAGYVGLNKLLKNMKGLLAKAVASWKAGGPEMRPTSAKLLEERYRDWCAWNVK